MRVIQAKEIDTIAGGGEEFSLYGLVEKAEISFFGGALVGVASSYWSKQHPPILSSFQMGLYFLSAAIAFELIKVGADYIENS